MSQPVLPPELHKIIIDIISDDAVCDAEQSPYRLKRGARELLGACSLVCKAWHGLTLQHTFYNAHFDLSAGERDRKRNAVLFQLLEVSPLIRRCIRRVEMYLEWSAPPGDVEKFCSAIGPIQTLRVVLQSSPLGRPLPRPSPLDSLHPILTTQHFRDLTIWSNRFPLRLLEDLTSLRSLTLEGVKVLDVDHSRDGTWRSSSLEKLVLTYPRRVLNQIWAVILDNRNVGLEGFFDHIKYLDIDLDTADVFRDTSWANLLARWTCIGSLVVRWTVKGEFISIRYLNADFDSVQSRLRKAGRARFLQLSQTIPWESFQDLRCLTYHISYLTRPSKRVLGAEVDPSTLLFTGPSRLPSLQELHITHYNRTTLHDVEDLDLCLAAIYQQNLNKTVEDSSSFPSLQTFGIEVKCSVSELGSLVLDKEKVAQRVVDQLPAIFGTGGRRETCSWVTNVLPNVQIRYLGLLIHYLSILII